MTQHDNLVKVYPAIYGNNNFLPIGYDLHFMVSYERGKNAIREATRGIDFKEGAEKRSVGRTIVYILSDLPADASAYALTKQVEAEFGRVAVKARIDECGLVLDKEKNRQVFEINFYGVERIRILDIFGASPCCRVAVGEFKTAPLQSCQVFEMLKKELFHRIEKLDKLGYKVDDWTAHCRDKNDELYLIDAIIFNALYMLKEAPFTRTEQRQLMTEPDVLKKWQTVIVQLERELNLIAAKENVSEKISKQIKKDTKKLEREAELRMRKQAIEEELGIETPKSRLKDLEKKISEAKMTQGAFFEARRELRRLKHISPVSPEYTIVHDYIGWLINLPWEAKEDAEISLESARQILDEDHYDLVKVKKRVIEYLAVRKLKPDKKGPILCFVGPPGAGKTSIAKSIARALNRAFVRVSLGGVRDEAEIRGHRRTYVGALPGRIIQGMKRAGSTNPVFDLDEIDKMGSDFRGDPVSALMEVLDPEQNSAFSDNYLHVAYDLSKVIFICTANSLEPIPPPLLDRLEVIKLSGYTREEKLEIGKRHLVKKQLQATGVWDFRGVDFFTDDCLQRLISSYTKEAGVRGLEREIVSILGKMAVKIAKGEPLPTQIYGDDIPGLLGPEQYLDSDKDVGGHPGIATGLSVDGIEGQTLIINASKMPGKGKLIITGNLKEVLKESAQVAYGFTMGYVARASSAFNRMKTDIHILCEEGAILKDGPSAGVAMATALASLILGLPVREDTAMTGELTLHGKILPVGGIRDKILAAERAGKTYVLIPERNKADLIDVPESAKAKITILPMSSVEDVIKFALFNQ